MRPEYQRKELIYCTVSISEELPRLATGGVFQSSPDAGIAAVGVSCVTVDQVRLL